MKNLSKLQIARFCLLVFGSTGLATALTLLVLTFRLPLNVVLFYLLAVMACAFWGGYAAGLFATVISVMAVPYLFIPDFTLARVDQVRAVAFVALSMIIGRIRQGQLRAERMLRKANEELEQRVEERTRLLSEEIGQRKQAQEELASSEQRFRALVEQSADGFALLGADGALTYVGHPILGHEPHSVVGIKILDMVHPEDRNRVEELLEWISRQPGAAATGEFRVRNGAGEWRWVEGAAKNALAIPAVGALILTYRDVTTRREADLAHHERAQRLQLALEAGRMGTWEWDLAQDRVLWSEQLNTLFGLSGSSFTGSTEEAAALIHPDDLDRLKAAFHNAIDTGAALQQEFRILSPAGDVRWLLTQGRTFYDEKSRQPVRMLGVTADIEERKRGAEAFAKLAAIVEHSDDAIASCDLHGAIQTWNRAAERLYGYTAEEIAGRPLSLLMPPENQEQAAALLRGIRDGSKVQRLDIAEVRKDGSRVDVSVTVSPICDPEGNLIGVSHVSRDMTHQKRLEEQVRQKQKLESLGVLAGGIAHDFNNLLVGIMGNTSLVLDSLADDDPNKPVLDDVLVASSRSADLVRQLLAYAGKGRLETRSADLSSVVQQIAKLVQSSLSRNVELQFSLYPSLPAVTIDPVQIQQVVMNLVINGAEAIGSEQPGVVRVLTGRRSVDEAFLRNTAIHEEIPPGEYVYLEVSDNGCGMDEATKERIFDPFFTTKFAGRGLGLAAVMGIVRRHRGALQVYSEPGRGTTFKVFLPAAEVAAEHTPQAAPTTTAHNGSGTVLVVDDEALVRGMARNALERIGYRVLLAENGREGLDLYRFERSRIRAVVLDWAMPVLDGEEMLRHIRRDREDVAVLLSSGFSEMEAMQRFGDLRVSGFLQKPYTSSELAQKLHSVLSES